MYIEPNTIIKLYTGMPLDTSYQNTLYFDSLASQTSFFHTNNRYHKTSLTRQTYQRVEKGKMRIAIKADEIYTCNYLAFQNSNYGNKWFYAFITGIEYINNETSEVSFVLDILQTYFFDITFNNCFIERQHTIGDAIGENITDEPIAIGDYVTNSYMKSGLFNDYSVVLATTEGSLFSNDNVALYTKYPAGLVGGMPSLITYIVFSASVTESISAVQTIIDNIVAQNKVDSIISLSLIPTALVPSVTDTTVKIFNTSRPTTLKGYTPKNNKLFTYPYSYFSVENGHTEQVYRYEYFTDPSNITFELDGTLSNQPQVSMTPLNYMNITKNFLKKQVISDFPFLAYSIDTYKQWLATQGQAYNISIAGGFLNALTGSVESVTPYTASNSETGETMKGATWEPGKPMSALLSLMQTQNSAHIEQTKGDKVQGQNSATIDIATRAKDFYTIHKTLTPSYLRIVDDYFTRYGYAIKRNEVPVFKARKHFTYIKTAGCQVIGNAPADDIARIGNIIDKGITFWVNANEVGSYSEIITRDNGGIV